MGRVRSTRARKGELWRGRAPRRQENSCIEWPRRDGHEEGSRVRVGASQWSYAGGWGNRVVTRERIGIKKRREEVGGA